MRLRNSAIALLILVATLSLSCASSTEAQRSTSRSADERYPGWRTNTAKRSIDLSELMSGGPPKDGIPAVDRPNFISIAEAGKWLGGNEPVIALEVDGEARAYPLQILIWHEIVNDEIKGVPVAVTFCPLCYSAIAFDRRADGRTLTFGVTGMLRHSDMVMYDRETESWWQQFTGEAIVGDQTGKKLQQQPAQIVSFKQFAEAHPESKVLSRETGYRRDYGRNPYVGYDDVGASPFLYRGKKDSRLRPMEKIVAVAVGGIFRAYPYEVTRKRNVIHDRAGAQELVVFHADGAASALDSSEIGKSRDAGATGVFEPRIDEMGLHFRYENGHFVDAETGSRWNVLGQAVSGKLRGRRLRRIVHGDYFAFAWLAFRPDTEIFRD
ncbi:MAG: DUF3179 domain-containing protein [Acidobacteriota bacterium]|nr:DUF3179 domain-containing protein [Acidobacteriota bacterium]